VSRAGVIELTLAGRGPRRAFVFDQHRLALPCWAELTRAPALVLTLDRHFDTVPPRAPPPRDLDADALDAWARERLDGRNVDHLLAAMAAGVVSHALCVARARPQGAVTDARWGEHELVCAPTVERLSTDWGRAAASPEGRRAHALVQGASAILLDVDLDCFTSPNDAEPTSVVPWPRDVIADFVLPRGSEAFWRDVLAKCVGFTFAREPGHCGGLVAAGRLFEAACEVLFVRLLEADLP
jgi:hypothetical protein